MHLHFNTDYLVQPNSPSALSEGLLDSVVDEAAQAVRAVTAMEELGQLGFLHLDLLQAELDSHRQTIAAFAFDICFHIVVGIGGSSLGAKTILSALAPDSAVKTFFLETTDPLIYRATIAQVEWPKTLVTVISKSGNTLETLAIFFALSETLQKALPDWKSHLLIVTDAERGELRSLATTESLRSLPVPEAIGGRFSVLTAVGMVPAIVAGVDVERLLHGAQEMKRQCEAVSWRENPALALALYQYLAHKKRGRSTTVFMPYWTGLRELGEWVAQLWGESIGKKMNTRGEEIHEGFTPVKALGSIDQHSQCQLYLEGPRDKWGIFIDVAQSSHDIEVPVAFPDLDIAHRLKHRSFQDILRMQRKATAQALFEQGMPSLTIEISRITEEAVGQFFFLFELQTAYMGALYGINAFDQPGVERIKQLTFKNLEALDTPNFVSLNN